MFVFKYFEAKNNLIFRNFYNQNNTKITQKTPDSFKIKKEENTSFIQQDNTNKYILPQPKNVEQKLIYDPVKNRYKLLELVNGKNIKPPMYISFEEYMDIVEKNINTNAIKARNTSLNINNKSKKDPVEILKEESQGVFGEGGIEIVPQGNFSMMAGYKYNKVENPFIPKELHGQGLIDFDQNINVSVTGKIGDKFQNTLRYNTQGGFGFESQNFKLAYKGKEDEILRNIEAGNITFDIPTRLISGSQALFGLKSELQFGKLNVKSVISQKNSNTQSKIVENGAEVNDFQINVDQYDVNKHFFLAQYFRNNYEKSVSNLPLNLSQIQVTDIEVWISNRSNTTQAIRDVVCFEDMGENNPYSSKISSQNQIYPSNNSNNLYDKIKNNSSVRDINTCQNSLLSMGLNSFKDFEKSFMRKLSSSEFTYNPKLGYITINSSVQNNDVIGVSFIYTYNGQQFQVGDMSKDVVLPDSLSNAPGRVIFVKMLKSSNSDPTIPRFDLMMKNIYSLNAYQVSNNNFRLDVFYNDPSGGLKRYLPKGNLQNKPLIQVLNLDNLNLNNDPYPDGVFDFVPEYTIQAKNGKIIFPVLEPFGSHIKKKLEEAGSSNLASLYTYQQLYDSTQYIAQQYPELNRYIIKGTYQSSNNKRIRLGGFGIPEGSVKVYLNGQELIAGKDYTIEYGLGYVELEDHIIGAGGKVEIRFDNQSMFSTQQKNFTGLRLEYKANDNLKLGSTYQKLGEKPMEEKPSYGEDPIKNQIFGADITFNNNIPKLTTLLDKLPFYKTSEPSSINLYGEVAKLVPGHYNSIGDKGTIYIDDFESSSVSYSIGSSAFTWKISSTPQGATDEFGKELFPESKLFDDYKYGYNRAKLSWYNINLGFYNNYSSFPAISDDNKYDIYQRLYRIRDIYPNKNQTGLNDYLQTLDFAFYPNQKGPYNFEYSNSPTPNVSLGINNDNTLKAPESRWAGIQKSIENSNFESNNIEFIQFWMLDPFEKNQNNKGDMYFNLGYISEDVLKDSRMGYEHGLYDENGSNSNLTATSNWAKVPTITPITNAFDNDPNLRAIQDVGLDGYSNELESIKFKEYLDKIKPNISSESYDILSTDPSLDNFLHYTNTSLFKENNSIFSYYKQYNNIDNNTPINTSGVVNSSYNTPDNEDINKDNTLNENEAFFQYRIKLYPGMNVNNHPYIVSSYTSDFSSSVPDPQGKKAIWHQFRIPIREFYDKVGQINDFRNIQFIRMFLTNFSDSTVIRTTDMEFIRNQWRKYTGSLKGPIDNNPIDNSEKEYFNVGQVGLEENSTKEPINYVVPNGIVREIGVNSTANTIQLNEKSLSISVCNLKDGEAKACFKNLTYDFRQFEKILLNLHLENSVNTQDTLKDNEISAFIRFGSDFKENFYEYEIPLKVTKSKQGGFSNYNSTDKELVWPDSNIMKIIIDDFVKLKLFRNNSKLNSNTVYVDHQNDKNISIIGNPDIGNVKIAMLGIRNRASNDPNNFLIDDDGKAKCVDLWANELRMEGLNEEGGVAALINVDLKLADLGNILLSGNYASIGFGQINQRVAERSLTEDLSFGGNTNLHFGKFFPTKWGVQLPFFATYSKSTSTPKYDPYQQDIKTIDQYESIKNLINKDSADIYKNNTIVLDERAGFSFNGVRIVPQSEKPIIHPLSIQNFILSYSFNSIKKSSPFVQKDWTRNYMGEIKYSFSTEPKYIFPFKNIIKTKKQYLNLIRDFNFNIVPSNIEITNTLNRQYGIFQQRTLPGESFVMKEQYIKNFFWDRTYAFSINLAKNLSLSYNAKNNARIDEIEGPANTQLAKDTVWDNLKKLGRNLSFSQSTVANYNVPINKLPYLNFISTSSINYNSSFNWNTGGKILDMNGKVINSPLGNSINNSQNVKFEVNAKMSKLYNNFEIFKKYDVNKKNTYESLTKEQKNEKIEKLNDQKEKLNDQKESIKILIAKLKEEKKKIKNDTFSIDIKKKMLKKKKSEIKKQKDLLKKVRKDIKLLDYPNNPFVSAIIQPITAIKDINASYIIDNSTTINGYTQNTKNFGVDYSNEDHLNQEFTFGIQPNTNIFSPLDKYASMRFYENMSSKNMLTKDSLFNSFNINNLSKTVNATMTIMPFKNLKIDLTLNSKYTQSYSELYKYNENLKSFEHLNPMEVGSYTYSDINLLSSINNLTKVRSSENLTLLNSNRQIYGQLFHQDNINRINSVYFDPIDSVYNNNYYYGYGPLQQDILTNSFLTTYRGGTASKSSPKSAFDRFPLPNWKISYSGLKELSFLKKIFTNITFTSGYASTTTISSFNTDLRYIGDGTIKNPTRIDSLSNNFIPFYNIPTIGITENYNPLIGMDFKTKGNVSFGYSISSKRQVLMSMIDYQITENRTNDLSARCGFSLKNLMLPFSDGKGNKIELENDLNFNFQLTLSDSYIVNYKIGQNIEVPVGGQYRFTFSPKIDYKVNKTINLSLFYNHSYIKPKILQSYPQTNISAGINMNMSLAQ